MLRELRVRRGLSKADVARAIGVTWLTPALHESGRSAPNPPALRAYCELYGVTAEELDRLAAADARRPVDPEELDEFADGRWSTTRKAVEQFLASPLAMGVTECQAEALRSMNLNAVSPTIHQIYDIWRTTDWRAIEARMVDGKVPSARGAKITPRKSTKVRQPR